MRRQAVAEPYNRDGIWYLFRRVPKEFRTLENRAVVRVSTQIRVADDPRGVRARPAVRNLDTELHAYWRARRDGRGDDAKRRFEAAQQRVRAFDMPYREASELAAGPLEDLLKRVNLLIDRNALDSAEDVAAVLGGEQRPRLMVNDLQREFEAIEAVALAQMNDTQRRKASGTRRRSLENFRRAIGGNKALADLNRSDGLAFRTTLQDRVASGRIDVGTANREMGTVSAMLKTVSLTHQLELPAIFRDLRIKGALAHQRLPFSSEWIARKILAPGALDGLNSEARAIVFLMIDHGMRPSEVHDCLVEGTVHLGAEIPFVSIEPVGKVLKTLDSAREIPLVGRGPDMLREHRNGFPRYRGKDAFSATVNRYFRENGLMETPAHTIYGLRHSFEDRLTAVEAPEKVVASLMGHKWHRPKYGSGPTLQQKREWLNRIALTGQA